MLREILLPFLKRVFSHADRFSWLSFTFDKNEQLVTCRRGRSALLERLTYCAYVIYIVTQVYGILWHNRSSTRVTKLNSTLFVLPHVAAVFVMLYWKADPGIPVVLNIMTNKRTIHEEKKGNI